MTLSGPYLAPFQPICSHYLANIEPLFLFILPPTHRYQIMDGLEATRRFREFETAYRLVQSKVRLWPAWKCASSSRVDPHIQAHQPPAHPLPPTASPTHFPLPQGQKPPTNYVIPPSPSSAKAIAALSSASNVSLPTGQDSARTGVSPGGVGGGGGAGAAGAAGGGGGGGGAGRGLGMRHRRLVSLCASPYMLALPHPNTPAHLPSPWANPSPPPP